mgnify:CR=1 FL=1
MPAGPGWDAGCLPRGAVAAALWGAGGRGGRLAVCPLFGPLVMRLRGYLGGGKLAEGLADGFDFWYGGGVDVAGDGGVP